MNFIYLLLATVLLYTSCLASKSKPDNNEAAEKEIISWLDIVTKRPMISPLYWAKFAAKYKRYEVQLFTGNVLSFYGQKHRIRVFDKTGIIHIADQRLAVPFLENFGRGIKKLYIAADFSKAMLENTKQPMRVAALRIDISQNASNVQPFNVIFPDIAELSIRLESDVDYSYLNCELPNLMSLDICVTKESWKKKAQIEGMLAQNQHIRSLEFSGFPDDYIKTINRIMPDIEMLTLYGFDTANETVQFDNVKHLTIYGDRGQSGHPGAIEYIMCPKAQTLEFFYSPRDFKAWRTFFRNHPDLLTISLRESRIQDYTEISEGNQLMQLISTELKLIGFKMHSSNFIPLETIKQFVATHPKLMVFHLTTFPGKTEIMVRKLPNGDWQVGVMYDNRMVFAGSYDEYEALLKESSRK